MTVKLCANCHRMISPTVHSYTLRIEVFAGIEESLTISQGEMETDHIQEMKDIIAKLESMNEDEVRDQEQKVYTRFNFAVCPACRHDLVRKLCKGAISSP
jgi:hypothetical protein